jgi:hypothetical protein
MTTKAPAEEETKAIRLDLPASMQLELRIEAAKRNMSMAAMVRELVGDFLDRARKGGPK